MFTFNETLSNLLNAAVVAGTVAFAALAPTATPASVPPHRIEHTGFNCVRPFFHDVVTIGTSPYAKKVFGGFLPCHETYPVDKDGFLDFPEA
jgi:hypothetical protein